MVVEKRQMNKEIEDKKVTVEVNEKRVQSLLSKSSKRTLVTSTSLSLKWGKQCYKIKEKLIEAIFEIKKIEIVAKALLMD